MSTTVTLTPTLNPYHLTPLTIAPLELAVPVAEDTFPEVVGAVALVPLYGAPG